MTSLIIEDSTPQARQLVDYISRFPFVKIETSGKQIQRKIECTEDFDELANKQFVNLSLSSLSKEWDTPEDEEWDTILAKMTPIR
jgi:hypothetical protein